MFLFRKFSNFTPPPPSDAELSSVINELESRIAGYKAEYAALIAQSEAIKLEMKTVEVKVGGGGVNVKRDYSREAVRLFRELLGGVIIKVEREGLGCH